ncbi:hypothetical protein [Neoaquamicrobium sediminum]|uniref:hypothetical protein n=1 Tax=Neoaquamicrobium sediminum TaxID=1849104 RepID=UPI001563D00A|nr:hypothetical protein [Mesorhizobium sediminum]NRC54171.1 hypothetical protein [Mesorhizobium sediminum]
MDNGRYKAAYGDHGKTAPDFERCCVEVTRYIGNWPHYGQCARKRGHGPDGAYCKQHDPEKVEARKAVSDEREKAAYNKQRLEWAGPRFFKVLEQIADGHNDPRTLAHEAIAAYRPKESE